MHFYSNKTSLISVQIYYYTRLLFKWRIAYGEQYI